MRTAAERLYYETRVEQLTSNGKGTWSLLNEILNRKRHSRHLPSSFQADSQEVSDPSHIEDLFCNYFTNIGPNRAEKISNSEKSIKPFLPENMISSIFLEEVVELEVIDISRSPRSGAAAGYDIFSMITVKQTIDPIIIPLTNIINLSIK